MERPRVPAWRRVGKTRAAAAVFLVAAAVGLLAAPPARAQSSADALTGCYADAPGGGLWFRIDRQGGRLVASWKKTGSRHVLSPATGDEEREVAEDLALNRFPGVSIVAGQTEDSTYRDTTYVVLSSALTWTEGRTQFVIYDVEFGAAPIFRVNCP